MLPSDKATALIKGVRTSVLSSSNRWSWEKKGTPYMDIAVTELRHFKEGNQAPGETCMKLEQKWLWKKGARSGSARDARNHLAKAHSKNANLLLNVGPDTKGNITESSVKALAEIGRLGKRGSATGTPNDKVPASCR